MQQRQLSSHRGHPALSYVDYGGSGTPLLLLHGTFGRGAIFAELARGLVAHARVIAPDQRGHGLSDRTDGYTREDFVEDAAHLLRTLGLGPAVVLGHSSGGVTAFQLATHHPDLVRALVIEDAGPLMRRPEIAHPVLDVRGWPASAPTKEELARQVSEAAGIADVGYFLQSAVRDEERGRWRFLFDWDDMMAVQEGNTGEWWADWLGSTCPALVLRGGGSTMLPADLAREMVDRRADTHLVTLPDAGHWIHDDDPAGVAAAVTEFLRRVG
ncbi:alpha/beta hydrolase [Streptomyces sp. YGL11-2]|uniref:alpha/beta fold hydrolase n=1 Tax=Streptomyces sp. YGL11-2 TaxID=3414028 RepID=UPI003CEDC1BE